MSEERNRLGATLTRIRKDRELSRRQVASAQKIGLPRISRVERGDSGNLSWETLLRWLSGMDADLYDLADAYYQEPGTMPIVDPEMRYKDGRALRLEGLPFPRSGIRAKESEPVFMLVTAWTLTQIGADLPSEVRAGVASFAREQCADELEAAAAG